MPPPAPSEASAPQMREPDAARARRRRLDERAQQRARQAIGRRRGGERVAHERVAARARGGERVGEVEPVVELGDGERHDRAGAAQPLDERVVAVGPVAVERARHLGEEERGVGPRHRAPLESA